jgi:hypothetical protein
VAGAAVVTAGDVAPDVWLMQVLCS